jgi:hypothetical protein
MGRHCEPKPNEMNPFAVKSTTVTATTLKWKSFYFNLYTTHFTSSDFLSPLSQLLSAYLP